MHIQARSSTRQSAFAMDDHDGGGVTISATYGAGALSEILRVLEGAGFNLRAAGGRAIELGGDFSYWVDPRRDTDGNLIDRDHDEATQAAADLVTAEGFDTHIVEVHARLLSDEPGALRAFVDEVRDAGALIEEVSVGTPDPDGRIPVQVFTARQTP
ncbi:MAG: hypothetical protein WEG56_12325 [Chloroflexota bacterium]